MNYTDLTSHRALDNKIIKYKKKYPARFYIQDRLKEKTFPDWFQVLKQNRLTNGINQGSQERVNLDPQTDSVSETNTSQKGLYSESTIADCPISAKSNREESPSHHISTRHTKNIEINKATQGTKTHKDKRSPAKHDQEDQKSSANTKTKIEKQESRTQT